MNPVGPPDSFAARSALFAAGPSTIAFNNLLVRAGQIIESRKDLVHSMLYDRLSEDGKANAHAVRRHLWKELKRLQVEIGNGLNVLRPSQATLKILADARRWDTELREGVVE